MPGPRKYGAHKAVALLATCMVVLGGALTCTFIAMMGSADQGRALMTAAACFVGIVLLLWLLRDRAPENQAATRWSWLGYRRRKIEYQVKLKRPPAGTGHNAPPTAETVRGLTGGLNTWVPAQRPEQRESKPN
ncbi:MAG: hypothetical protein ACT4QC_20335 [Planctomycetaceae bacterium]